ncbi:hypothetical protein JD844_012492 [Phrynosoma platyrhinos]|uniref:RNA-binding protein 5 n=1 Tax=Phrynosoma platyrhinos TaxID=52577 RepID=A0ABQ7TJW0_PHRPL|nr:hypothetical protein JD844_012492 [Phrynosoma platyrhinos]
MGSDKRVSRTERSGRYGSIIDRDDRDDRDSRSRRRDSDYKRSSEERRNNRYDDYGDYDGRDYDGRDYDGRDYDSPERERERERRNSDKSEDGYHSDGDHDYRNDISDEKESKTIMLRGLPITVTDYDIRDIIESCEGPRPADVRLMKRKTGVSRGFAFVEFYHFQDATSWMEANQKKLVIQGKQIAMHYSNPRPKFEDWLCNKCCLYNFRRRLKCFRCGADKFDSEQEVPPGGPEAVQSVDYYCDSKYRLFHYALGLIGQALNIAPHTVVESIMTALSPYASLAVNNIRLIKDKQTQQNRGFAFVQLSSAMDASQLLQILQSLQPPLKIDGKTIGVDFAKSARKDLLLPDGNRVSAFSVASTAIAAAQWSSTQPQSGEGGTVDFNYLQLGQDGYTQYTQVGENVLSLHSLYNVHRIINSFTRIKQEHWTQIQLQYQVTRGLVAAYSGDSDNEEDFLERLESEEEKLTDWKKLACLLCRRQFPNKEALVRHQQLSDLHKQNMDIYRRSRLSEQELEALEMREREMKYRDRAAERREKYGIPEPPEPKRKKVFDAGTVYAQVRMRGAGLGAKGSSYGVSTADSYKDAVRKAMFARFTEME